MMKKEYEVLPDGYALFLLAENFATVDVMDPSNIEDGGEAGEDEEI